MKIINKISHFIWQHKRKIIWLIIKWVIIISVFFYLWEDHRKHYVEKVLRYAQQEQKVENNETK